MDKSKKNILSEELNQIFESAAIVLMLVNEEGRVIHVNKSGIDLVGKNKDNILGLLGGEVFNCINAFRDGQVDCGRGPNCSQCIVRSRIEDTFATGKTYYKEEGIIKVIRNKEPIQLNILVSTSPIIAHQEKYVLLTIDNITKEKQIELALKKNEEKLKTVLKTVPDILFHLDKNGVFIDFYQENKQENLYVKPEEFIQKSIWEIFDEKLAAEIYEKISQALTLGDSVMEYQLPINGIQYYEAKFSKLNQNEIIASVRDITDRKNAAQALKKSEELYRLLADNSAEMIARHDEDGVFLYVSPSCLQLTGFQQDELMGTSAFDYFHPDDQEAMKENTKKITEQNIKTTVTFRFRCKNGNYKWFETNTHSIFDSKTGEVREMHASSRDVSERIEAQKKINAQNDELKELNAAKDKLFSIIAHDLKSPLIAISGLSELLLNNFEQYDVEKRTRFLKNILRSSKNTFVLLENLLEWSKLQTGKISFNPSPEKINEIIVEAINQAEINANQKNIKIHSSCDDKTIVVVDKVMINTVLRNLIANAIKFTPKFGSIQISVTKENNHLIVGVTDNGVGIPPEKIESLFNLTENTSTAGTENEQGSGLGLIICQEFIEMQGGKVWVESEVGKGSGFFFSIPLYSEF